MEMMLLPVTLQLAKLALDLAEFDRFDAIDEQLSVQMVELMLNAAPEQAAALALHRLAVKGHRPEKDPGRTLRRRP